MSRGRELRGQVALVTGASSGVGWQSALQLGKLGMRLCLTARREEALEQLLRQLGEEGVEAIAVAGDVTRDGDVARVVGQCVEHFGGLDVLANVASVQLFAPFEEYTWEEIARVVDVNFYGYLRFARAALPHFRRQGHGHIVNVLSVFSEMGFPLFSIYAATKHALMGWADSLRLELRGSGIHISNILLPTIATPFYDVAGTRLGLAPRPPPPVHAPELAARAVVRCVRRPHRRHVPVLLQGKLALGAHRWAPALVDAVVARWGARLVTRQHPVERPHGNLFAPPAHPGGPHGSSRVTPTWLRLGMDLAALGALLGGTGWVARGALRLSRLRLAR